MNRYCRSLHFRSLLGSSVAALSVAIASISPAIENRCFASPRMGVQAMIPGLGSSVAKAVIRYFGKEGAEEATEFMTRKGGQEIVERVTQVALREGGEETVDQVAKLTTKYGPDVVGALDNAPAIRPILNVVDELPEAEARSALSRLAAGSTGRELAQTVARRGTVALKAELKQPGVGGSLVRWFGDDGAKMADNLTADQAITIARHGEDISRLPLSQKEGIFSLMRSDTERFVGFVGRFVENNPGKTLFTAAGTTLILAESERMLGGDEIVYDADGNPVLVTKPGFLGRPAAIAERLSSHLSTNYIQPLFYAAITFVVVFGLIYTWKRMSHPTAQP